MIAKMVLAAGVVWLMFYAFAFAITGNVWYLTLSFPVSWIGSVGIPLGLARIMRP